MNSVNFCACGTVGLYSQFYPCNIVPTFQGVFDFGEDVLVSDASFQCLPFSLNLRKSAGLSVVSNCEI